MRSPITDDAAQHVVARREAGEKRIPIDDTE
jgi:hypothetical protein